MTMGLLFDADEAVAKWWCGTSGWGKMPFKFDACLGVVDEALMPRGAIFLHGFNGNDLQLSYYGEGTLTPGVARTLGQFILTKFDPSRLTVIVSKRNKRLIRSCGRFGFKLEGAQHCYYGKVDCNRNTGVRLVMFRDRMDQVAAPAALKKVS